MARGHPRPHPARLIVAALFALAAILTFSACDDGEGDGKALGPAVTRPPAQGEPRKVALGFGALPSAAGLEGYIASFAAAAESADIVMIQRAPPWSDFLPNATVSAATEETTRLERRLLAQYADLDLFFAIDPTDPATRRSRIASPPSAIDATKGFADPALREAFKSYVTYVASNYQPRYLAIGVEVNMLYERSREQFEAFVSLYDETYAIAKAASPGTLVFPTFQLEDLEGTLDQSHSPHWEVLDFFAGRMDALAVSAYPFLGEVRVATDVRPDYFSQLRDQFAGPILIATAGYSSAPVEGESLIGTEQDQQAFVGRLLADAEVSGIEAVIWVAANDPAVPATGSSAVLRDVGLRRSDGGEKLAWATWRTWARRPLR